MTEKEVLETALSGYEKWLILFGILVAIGVVGESVFSFLNFRKSERLRVILNNEASEQKERAAKAEKELLEVQNRLILQGSRSALLYGENREKLVAALRPFAGQKVEIRYCDQDTRDREVMSVSMLLGHTFELSGWGHRFPVMASCGGFGISVGVTPDANEATRRGAQALYSALVELPLVMVGQTVLPLNKAEIELQPTMKAFDPSGKELQRFPMGPDLIVVTVYAHPL